jgi:hypothetical protein
MVTSNDKGDAMVLNQRWRGCRGCQREQMLQPFAAVDTYSVKYNVSPAGVTVMVG